MKRKVKLGLAVTVIVLVSLFVYADGYDEFVHPAQIDDNDFKGLTDGVDSNVKGGDAGFTNGMQYNETPQTQDQLNQKYNNQGASTPNIDQTQYQNMNDSQRESYGKSQSGALQNQYSGYKSDYNNSAHTDGTNAELVWEVTSKERQIEANDTDLSVDSFNKLYSDIDSNQSQLPTTHNSLSANSTTGANFSQSVGGMEMISQMLDSTRSVRNEFTGMKIKCMESKLTRGGGGLCNGYSNTRTQSLNTRYSGWYMFNQNGINGIYNNNLYNIPQELLGLCSANTVSIHAPVRTLGAGMWICRDENINVYTWHNYNNQPNATFNLKTSNGDIYIINNTVHTINVLNISNQNLTMLNSVSANIRIFKGKTKECRSWFNVSFYPTYIRGAYGLGGSGSIDLCNDGKDLKISNGAVKPYICKLDDERYFAPNCAGNCGDGKSCSFSPNYKYNPRKFLGVTIGGSPNEDEIYIMSANEVGDELSPVVFMHDHTTKREIGVCPGLLCSHPNEQTIKTYCAFDNILAKKIMTTLASSPKQSQLGLGGNFCGGISIDQLKNVDWNDSLIGDDIKKYVGDIMNEMNLNKIEQDAQTKATKDINVSTTDLINNVNQINQQYGTP